MAPEEKIRSVFSHRDSPIGQYKMQTADCRPGRKRRLRMKTTYLLKPYQESCCRFSVVIFHQHQHYFGIFLTCLFIYFVLNTCYLPAVYLIFQLNLRSPNGSQLAIWPDRLGQLVVILIQFSSQAPFHALVIQVTIRLCSNKNVLVIWGQGRQKPMFTAITLPHKLSHFLTLFSRSTFPVPGSPFPVLVTSYKDI